MIRGRGPLGFTRGVARGETEQPYVFTTRLGVE